jgi:hypothetical protein
VQGSAVLVQKWTHDAAAFEALAINRTPHHLQWFASGFYCGQSLQLPSPQRKETRAAVGDEEVSP